MMNRYTATETNTVRKGEGFHGQRSIVLPRKTMMSYSRSTLISNIFITDIGFYPKAKFHYYERERGTSSHILLYCVDGKGWLTIGGKEVAVERDQFIIIPALLPHSYGSDDKYPWSIYWLHFKGAFSDQICRLLSTGSADHCSTVGYSEERIRLFDNIYNVLEQGYSDAHLQYASMCLWHFLSSFSFPDLFYLNEKADTEDAIDRSIAFMRANTQHVLSIRQLAEQAFISPSHYSALFKKKTGYPPLEFFNNIKIQKACQYLEFTNCNIKEISNHLGISDPYYFSRLFSKVMGLSPLEFRKRKKFSEGQPLSRKAKT